MTDQVKEGGRHSCQMYLACLWECVWKNWKQDQPEGAHIRGWPKIYHPLRPNGRGEA